MDTGQTVQVTEFPQPAVALSWSPNGEQLAYAMFVESPEPVLAMPPSKPPGATWAAEPVVIYDEYFRSDGRGYLKPGNFQIFVAPSEEGTARQLTHDDYPHNGPVPYQPGPIFGPIAWTNDSSSLLFSASRVDGYASMPLYTDIWMLNLETSELQRLTDRFGLDVAPAVSPNGDLVAYLGFDDRKLNFQNAVVHIMDIDGENERSLTEDLDRSVTGVQWTGSSNRLLISYEDAGRTRLAFLSLGGEIDEIADDVGGLSVGRPYTSGSFSVARDGAYAYTADSESRPADIAYGRRGSPIARLTDLNGDLLDHKALGNVEELTWKSPADEREIH